MRVRSWLFVAAFAALGVGAAFATAIRGDTGSVGSPIGVPTNSCVTLDGTFTCSGVRLFSDGTNIKFKNASSNLMALALDASGSSWTGTIATTGAISSTAGSGSLAFQASTDGAKTCLGATTVGACLTASGTTVTAAGNFNVSTGVTMSSGGNIVANQLVLSSGNIFGASGIGVLLSSQIANSSGAISVKSGTYATAYTTAGAELHSFINNSVEVANVDKDGSYTLVGNPTLQTCAAGIEGKISRDVLSGIATGKRTKLCLCTSDGASAYKWQNVVTGTLGTTTTCGTE